MDLYKLFLEHPTVTTDSRNCLPGSIFFALKGDKFNANKFAADALQNGCSYAVIDEAEYATDSRFIVVKDALKALQELSNQHRKNVGVKVIGITGTNGKTTTKELIASVLKEKFKVHYTQGNLNNHIGVPLTLLQLKSEHQLAIIEMGANHQGEIKALCNIAEPDFGIITNVGKAHLEGFGSFEGVKQTKAELYDFISKNGKGIFINDDNEYLKEMAKNAKVHADKQIAYSLTSNHNLTMVSGKINSCNPFLSMQCQTGTAFEVNTHLVGAYNAENILAAVAIGHFFGLKNSQIKHGIEVYEPQNNRSQFIHSAKNKLIVDAYNANPTSMRAAIINFSEIQSDNKLLILGDMLELGTQTEIEHQNIVDLISEKKFNNVFLVGNAFINTKSDFKSFQNVDELSTYFSEYCPINMTILIKGSRSIQLEKIIALL